MKKIFPFSLFLLVILFLNLLPAVFAVPYICIYEITGDVVSYCGTEIVGADAVSFETVGMTYGTQYGKDKNNVYYGEKIISGADPATFELVGNVNYSKDKNHVYYGENVFAGADPSSFELFDYSNYSKDKNHVYYIGPESEIIAEYVVEGADLATFELIDLDLAKDANNVYCDGSLLTTDVVNFSQGEANPAFAVDSNYVYWWCVKFENSDPATLVQLDGDFFKDKNNVYYQGSIIDVDLDSFEVLGGGYAKDKDSVYFRYDGAIAGADAATFQVRQPTQYSDPVNGECGDTYIDAYDDFNCYGSGFLAAVRNPDLNIKSQKPYFTDVEKDSLNYLYEQGIFTGYGDGTFGYDKPLTRAELLKIVMVAAAMPGDSTTTECFTDVKGDDWYVSYVCGAKSINYISGYPDGSFKPNNPTNKVEALKMIAKGLNWELKTDLVGKVAVYMDTYESEWYFPYVINALDKFYIEMNADRRFDPANSITRGDAAEILFRTLVSNIIKGGEGFTGADDLAVWAQKFMEEAGTI